MSPAPALSVALQQGSLSDFRHRVHWPGRKSCWQRALRPLGKWRRTGAGGLDPRENRGLLILTSLQAGFFREASRTLMVK